jgi:hypothetical protein
MTLRSGSLVPLLAGAAWLVTGQSPSHKHMAVEFHALPLGDSAAVTSLKLVEANGVALLYSSRSGPLGAKLSVARLNGSPVRTEALGSLSALPEQPEWDAVAGEGGSFSVVTTQAGSAISALSIKNTRGGASTKVNRRDGFGVFGSPHFVKGDPGPISSVSLVEGRTEMVLFPREADGGFGKYRKLETAVDGVVQDARLVRSGKDYLLFAKVMSIGSSASARREGSGKVIYPGVLHYVPLEGNFHSTNQPSLPLEGQLIIDFDVCAWGDGIAVFAATPKGYVLATGKLINGVFATGSWADQPHARPLGSPSILAAGSKLHLAALEAVGTPGARVVVAELP